MDEKYIEQADAVANSVVDAGIAKARVKQTKPANYEGFCTCGAEVPTERIDEGYFNCVHCQSAFECRGKFFYMGG